jgi:hypothetical protein
VASLRREGGDLVVMMNDLEKLGALRREVRVPLAAVRNVRVTESPFSDLRGIRAPGTGLPGVTALGTWRYRGGKDFAALYRGAPAVIVELEGAEFKRLLVSAHDAACVRDDLAADR